MYTVREASYEEEIEDGFSAKKQRKETIPVATVDPNLKSPRSVSKKSVSRNPKKKPAGMPHIPFITKTIQSVLNQAVADVANSISLVTKEAQGTSPKRNIQVLTDYYSSHNSQRDNMSTETKKGRMLLAPRHNPIKIHPKEVTEIRNVQLDHSDSLSDALEREIEQLLSENRSKTPTNIGLKTKQQSTVSQNVTKARIRNKGDSYLPSESLDHRELRRNTDLLHEKQSTSIARACDSGKKTKRLKSRPIAQTDFNQQTESSNHSNLRAMRRDNRGTVSLKVEISNININNITQSATTNRQPTDYTVGSPRKNQNQRKEHLAKSSIFFGETKATHSLTPLLGLLKSTANRRNRVILHSRKDTGHIIASNDSNKSVGERSAEDPTPSQTLESSKYLYRTPKAFNESSKMSMPRNHHTSQKAAQVAKPINFNFKLFSDKPIEATIPAKKGQRISLEQILKKPTRTTGSQTARTARARRPTDIIVPPSNIDREQATPLTGRIQISSQPQEESFCLNDPPTPRPTDNKPQPSVQLTHQYQKTKTQRDRKKFDLKSFFDKLQKPMQNSKEPNQPKMPTKTKEHNPFQKVNH